MSVKTIFASGMIIWLTFSYSYMTCSGLPILFVYDVQLDPSQGTGYGAGPGGPWDLSYINDPDQQAMMQLDQPFDQQMTGQAQTGNDQGSVQLVSPSGAALYLQSPTAQQVPQLQYASLQPENQWTGTGRSFDFGNNPFQYGSGPGDLSAFLPMSNQATGNVINSGSALQGSLFANGNSNTQSGQQGSISSGNALMDGSGIGIQGISVNSAGASTGGGGPGRFPPGAYPLGPSTSNALFLNNMAAAQGTVNGNSNTISQTGPGGNSFGSSSGSANGYGQGVQLTQVANSDSIGNGFNGIQYGLPRFKRAVPSTVWSGVFSPFSGLSFQPSFGSAQNTNGTVINAGPAVVGVTAAVDPTTGNLYTYYTTAVRSFNAAGSSGAAISSVAASSAANTSN